MGWYVCGLMLRMIAEAGCFSGSGEERASCASRAPFCSCWSSCCCWGPALLRVAVLGSPLRPAATCSRLSTGRFWSGTNALTRVRRFLVGAACTGIDEGVGAEVEDDIEFIQATRSTAEALLEALAAPWPGAGLCLVVEGTWRIRCDCCCDNTVAADVELEKRLFALACLKTYFALVDVADCCAPLEPGLETIGNAVLVIFLILIIPV
mmetsp:Transcript_14009/g.28335  ORF Transcript_14009/g.28335 Transcript_14009/m.28335 type:complete len:208 (-) Transcript_14009:583-1206(-)